MENNLESIDDLRYSYAEFKMSDSIIKKLNEDKEFTNFIDDVNKYYRYIKSRSFEVFQTEIKEIEVSNDKSTIIRIVYKNKEYK